MMSESRAGENNHSKIVTLFLSFSIFLKPYKNNMPKNEKININSHICLRIEFKKFSLTPILRGNMA